MTRAQFKLTLIWLFLLTLVAERMSAQSTSNELVEKRKKHAYPRRSNSISGSAHPGTGGVGGDQTYWQALAAGSSVLESENGIIYEVFPDDTRNILKTIEPPTPVSIGEKRVLP